MRKTLHIDETLLREARSISGATTDTDTVRLGSKRWSGRARTSACGRCVARSRVRLTCPVVERASGERSARSPADPRLAAIAGELDIAYDWQA